MGANTLTTLTPSRGQTGQMRAAGRTKGYRNDVVNRERQRPTGYVVRARGAAARTQVGAAGRPLHHAPAPPQRRWHHPRDASTLSGRPRPWHRQSCCAHRGWGLWDEQEMKKEHDNA